MTDDHTTLEYFRERRKRRRILVTAVLNLLTGVLGFAIAYLVWFEGH